MPEFHTGDCLNEQPKRTYIRIKSEFQKFADTGVTDFGSDQVTVQSNNVSFAQLGTRAL